MGEEESKPQEPVSVTLTFTSRSARDYFMGQLSDGWGERWCDLHWPHEQGVKFEDADTFAVEVFDEDWERVV